LVAKRGIPLTRDNYIAISYLGDRTYEDLEGEQLAECDELFDENGQLIQ
jgi:hypothetical protein